MSIGILVVDDDASFALEIEMMIDELGYKYLGNPKNNFQTLEAIVQEKPDLIIMDIDIDGAVDGITLDETIAYKKIPVIYITGFKSQEYFNNYCYLFAEDKRHVIKMSLKKVLENINQENIFLRIHRNFIVQRKYITNFNLNNNTIKINNKSISVKGKYKNQVIAL